MTPKEFLEKQGYREIISPLHQKPFSPTFQWKTVVRLLEEYVKQSTEKEKKVVKLKITKTFIDPVFGVVPSPRFRLCKIYLDGKWKAELWDDEENEEYHLSFKNFEGTKVTLIFPTIQDRLTAASHIIPDRELELPHNYPLIQTISDNVGVKQKPHPVLQSLVLGGTVVVLGWAMMKRFYRQGQKVLEIF